MSVQEVDIIGKVKDKLVPSKKRHRIIYGGRGKGASWSIARILLSEGICNDFFIPCVREVQKTIKYSVKKLLDDTIDALNWKCFYKSTDSEIKSKVSDTVFAFFGLRDFNADNIKSLEGAHRCWVAEAQSISRRSINILRPTIRTEGSVFWWDFNPRYETDPVYVDYVLNKDPNAEVLKLSWRDNKWFNKTLQAEKESDYMRNEEEADHIWEGQLLNQGNLIVCPLRLVKEAMDRPLQHFGHKAVGADIAHQGGDEIVFYKRWGFKVIQQYITKYQSGTKTAKDLMRFTGDKSIPINIDNGSMGAVVADILEDKGYNINRISFGGTPIDTEHYEDVATEMYFNLRDTLEFSSIPNDNELMGQLSQRMFKWLSSKRGYEVIKIESKKEFKEHAFNINKSPDRADGLALCFYEPETSDAFNALNGIGV